MRFAQDRIDHFTVLWNVTKPLYESEVRVDLVMIEIRKYLAWQHKNLHLKSGKVCIITKSTLASLQL